MRYKVTLTAYSGSSPSNGAGITSHAFYTKAQAVQFCQAWREIGTSTYAYLWDGDAMTVYAPIP